MATNLTIYFASLCIQLQTLSYRIETLVTSHNVQWIKPAPCHQIQNFVYRHVRIILTIALLTRSVWTPLIRYQTHLSHAGKFLISHTSYFIQQSIAIQYIPAFLYWVLLDFRISDYTTQIIFYIIIYNYCFVHFCSCFGQYLKNNIPQYPFMIANYDEHMTMSYYKVHLFPATHTVSMRLLCSL